MLELIVAALIFASYKTGRAVERYSQEQTTENPKPIIKDDLPVYDIIVEGDDRSLYAYTIAHEFLAQAVSYQELLEKVVDIKGSCILDVHMMERDWSEERP